MDVSEILRPSVLNKLFEAKSIAEVSGWLVIIDFRLFLIRGNFSEDYENEGMIEISDFSMAFPVMETISAIGGGKSFIFHEARALGVVCDPDVPKIELLSLWVKERLGDFLQIDISSETREKLRKKYEEFFSKRKNIKSDDWLDFA